MATSDVQTLEREAAEARARLADTLERLTSPSTAQAVKQELTDYAQGLKNQALDYVQQKKDELMGTGRDTAQGYTDSLKQRALGNPLGLALIGAGVGWHLYRHPPITTLLVGTGIALLMKGANSGPPGHLAYRNPYDADQPRGYVPGGVAGYGYPVDEESFASGMKNRLTEAAYRAEETARGIGDKAMGAVESARTTVMGAADHARSTVAARTGSAAAAAGNAAESTRTSLLHTADSAREAVLGAADSARASVAHAADGVRTTVSDTVESARSAVTETVENVRTTASDFVHRTASTVSHAADDARRRATQFAGEAPHNPWVLGALGVAAGAGLIYAMRGSMQGDDRTVRYGSEPQRGRGNRGTAPQPRTRDAARRAGDFGSDVAASASDMASGVSDAASRTASAAGERLRGAATRASEAAGGVASSTAEAASGIGEAASRTASAAGDAVTSAASSAYAGVSSVARSAADLAASAARRAPQTTRRVQRQVSELGDRYPLLLGLASLAVGAALGGATRVSERERRLMGPYSERLRQRAREVAEEQFNSAKEAAAELADQLKTQVGGERRDPSADFETVIGGGPPPVEENRAAAPGVDGGSRPIPTL